MAGMNEPNEHAGGAVRPRRRRMMAVAIGLAVALLGIALWCWFAPSGTGESRLSPDGRYEAHADNLRRGTVTGRREQYAEIRVTEVATGREVWRVVHRHHPEAAVPEYGSRGMRFIVWAEDSSAVTVPVAGGRTLSFHVP